MATESLHRPQFLVQSDTRLDGIEEQQPIKSKGKQPTWKDLDTLGAVRSIINLTDAVINGSFQRKFDWHKQLKIRFDELRLELKPSFPQIGMDRDMKIWNPRSGRLIADQDQKGISTCKPLKGCLRVVKGHQFTENTSDSVCM